MGVKEGVEEQSELILAAKDMMDKVTSFLEDSSINEDRRHVRTSRQNQRRDGC